MDSDHSTGPSAGRNTPALSDALAVIDHLTSAASAAGQLVVVAITDRAGTLVAFGRMDGGEPRWIQQAQRKAYTSSVMGRSTTSLGVQLRKREMSILEYGDPKLTSIPGGAPVPGGGAGKPAGVAVGIAGNGGPERDDELATLGARLLAEAGR
jgi:uncharacterized protein GlcG (DUF336 family)